MVPWQGILSPEQINQVAAYVLSRHMEATGRSLESVMAEPTSAGDEARGAGVDSAQANSNDTGGAGGA